MKLVRRDATRVAREGRCTLSRPPRPARRHRGGEDASSRLAFFVIVCLFFSFSSLQIAIRSALRIDPNVALRRTYISRVRTFVSIIYLNLMPRDEY